jgi:hypothetical protein
VAVKVKRTAWQCCHGAFESKHELRRLFARYVMELRSRRVSQRLERPCMSAGCPRASVTRCGCKWRAVALDAPSSPVERLTLAPHMGPLPE